MQNTKRPKPRARATAHNEAGRYEGLQSVACDDGWGGDVEHDPPVVTQVHQDNARRIISYNRSPDLPFDRSINPYRGCEHGCIYCFARPSHAYLGLSPGLDFETRLIVRPNAAACLAQELSAARYAPAPIALGTNTDPYQPIERDHKITRACLEVLQRTRHPVAIVTKGTLVERDIDILSEMATDELVRVGISVTTLDASLSRRMEPRAPSPHRRLACIERLAKAGIEVRVMAAPMVPALTDPELESILQAGADAGACHASWIMLRLPREVSTLWKAWLAEHAPDRAARIMARLREMHGGQEYDSQWGHRMRGEGHYAQMVQDRFLLALKRTGLRQNARPLRCDLFTPPPKAARSKCPDPRQMHLF